MTRKLLAILACALLLVPSVAPAQVLQLDVSDGNAAHGTMTLAPSHLLHPSSATMLNTTSGQPLYFGKGVATTPTDIADEFFERYANYTGGTNGFVSGAVRISDTVSAGAKAFEWALTSIMDNSSSAADGSENVAGYFQAHKRNGGGTWALTAELQDHNANPTSPSVTLEYDLQAKGTDSSNARVITDLWAKSDDGLAATVAYGLRLNTDANTTINHGIYFNTGNFIDGLNLSNGSFLSAALILADGQKHCVTALCGGYWQHSGTALNYITSSGTIIALGDTGTTNLSVATALNFDASNRISLAGGKTLCLDGSTCSYGLLLSGGNTVQIKTASGTAAQFTGLTSNLLATTATTMDASTSVSVPSSGKVCLNGSGCTTYISYNGTNIVFVIGGTQVASVNATGRISTTAGYAIGLTNGANCLGAPSGSFGANGGMVTAC